MCYNRGMAYPIELRKKAIEALRKGHTKKEISVILGLGINTLRNWEKLEEETGSLKKRPVKRKPRKLDREALREYCNKNPFATHVEAGVYFNCSERAIRHAKKTMNITRKKRQNATKNGMKKSE